MVSDENRRYGHRFGVDSSRENEDESSKGEVPKDSNITVGSLIANGFDLFLFVRVWPTSEVQPSGYAAAEV
jgi:hypothetical protein